MVRLSRLALTTLLLIALRECKAVDFYPFGPNNNDSRANPCEDCGAARIDTPFPIPFFGQTFNTIWVNTNGFMSLGADTTDLCPMVPSDVAKVAPYFADWAGADEGDLWAGVRTDAAVLETFSRVLRFNGIVPDTFVPTWALVATWDGKSCNDCGGRTASVQAVLVTNWRLTAALFLYSNLDFPSGDDWVCLKPMIGFDYGDGENVFETELSRSVEAAMAADTSNVGDGVPGLWGFRCSEDQQNVCDEAPCTNGGECLELDDGRAFCKCSPESNTETCAGFVPEESICHCYNDPHCRTFDGRYQEHHLECRSKFVTQCNGTEWPANVPAFNIMAEHSSSACGFTNPYPISCVDKVFLELGSPANVLIKLDNTPSAWIDADLANPPGLVPAVLGPVPGYPTVFIGQIMLLGVNTIRVTIIVPGGAILIDMQSSKFFIRIRGTQAVQRLRGSLCGICGQFNGDVTDDYEGMTLEDFQTHYLVQPLTPAGCDTAVTPIPKLVDVINVTRCADPANLATVENTCGKIVDPVGPFAICQESTDRIAVRDACMVDSCLDEAFTETNLAGFAAHCGHYGMPGDWRNLLDFPINCPAGMEYSRCAHKMCRPTCANLHPCRDGRPPSLCLEGCVCRIGTVWDDGTQSCVDPRQCHDACSDEPCVNGGQCIVLDDGRPFCRCPPGTQGDNCGDEFIPEESICQCYNDPHCQTFDGKYQEHHLECRSKFVTQCNGAEWPANVPAFNIMAEHSSSACGFTNPYPISCVDKVFLELGSPANVLIKLDNIPSAWIDVDLANPPGLVAAIMGPVPGYPTVFIGQLTLMGMNTIRVTIIVPGGAILVDMQSSRFTIRVRGTQAVERLRGSLCGICGFFNGDVSDDYEGMTLEDFQTHYLVQPLTPDGCNATVAPMPQLTDIIDQTRCADADIFATVAATCGTIVDPEGPFAICQESPDRNAVRDACMLDTCLNDAFAETNLAGFAAQCGHFGMPGDWRDLLGFDIQCPQGMEYSRCAHEACRPTCANPNPCRENHPPSLCLEGCICLAGTVWDDNSQTCIPPRDCGACASSPCMNGGECIELVDGRPFCRCTPEFEGPNCGQNVPTSAICHCNDDPHCHTFDGLRNEHHTPCRSYFVTQCNGTQWPAGVPHIDIMTEHSTAACGWLPGNYHCIHKIFVDVDNLRIVLDVQQGVLMANPKTQPPAVIPTGCLPWPFICSGITPAACMIWPCGTPFPNNVHVTAFSANGLAVTIILPGLGAVRVELITTGAGSSTFNIKILGQGAVGALSGVLCGNCGKFNGISADDFDGTNVLTPAFHASYLVQPKTPPCCDDSFNHRPFTNPAEGQDLAAALRADGRCADADVFDHVQELCGIINDANGPFGICHETADREQLFENCLMDGCGDEKFIEANLIGFANHCGRYGMPGNWRDETDNEFHCLPGMEYRTCVHEECQPTCDDLNPCEERMPLTMCIEGCICSGDHNVWDPVSSSCIPPTRCGHTQPRFPDEFRGIGTSPRAMFTPCEQFPADVPSCSLFGFCLPVGTVLTSADCEQQCTCSRGGFSRFAPTTSWKCACLRGKAADKCQECADTPAHAECEQFKFINELRLCINGACLQPPIDEIGRAVQGKPLECTDTCSKSENEAVCKIRSLFERLRFI